MNRFLTELVRLAAYLALTYRWVRVNKSTFIGPFKLWQRTSLINCIHLTFASWFTRSLPTKKKKKKIRGEGNRNSAPKDWEEILFIWWNTPFSHLRSFGEIHLSPALDHLIVNIYRNISKIVKDAWQCRMSIGEMEK